MVIGYEADAVCEVAMEVEPESTESSGPMDSPWPMKCHNNRHTSQSPYSTAHIDGLEKWRFLNKYDIDGSPIIGDDGTIFFGTDDWYIFALYPNGTLKWEYKTGGDIISAPALAEGGTLYIGAFNNRLYALNSSTGKRIWTFSTKGNIASSPAIAEDGTVYFGTMGWPDDGDCNIYAVNPNGTLKWLYHTGYKIICDPAIGNDGTIFIGSGDTYFYAMNPNGTLRWRFKTGHYIKGPASIADDGTIYIGSWDDYLYALYPNNGTMKWRCKVGEGTETNPSIAEDGTIYVGGTKLWAIYPNGTKKWTFDLGEGRHIHRSCPAISSEGTIYVGTNIGTTSGGDIIAINPDGTEKWRKRICYEWCDSSPCIGKDGTVYIGSTTDWGGYLHAFGSVESNSPPEPPTISGKTYGKVGEEYEYKFIVVDPENNPISFYIEWGDGTHTDWTFERASGENCYYSHTWTNKGNYTIRVKAKDTLGEESDWVTLKITMPKTQNVYLGWLERLPRLCRLLDALGRV